MKKYIIGFIVGIIVATTVGVSATILYSANEIGFTPDNDNWQVDNLEDALNDLYSNKGGNLTIITGQNNRNDGVTSYTIEHDNNNALIVSGNDALKYSINSQDNFVLINERLGSYDLGNGWGTIYKIVNLKKDDVLYLQRDTTNSYGYIIVY